MTSPDRGFQPIDYSRFSHDSHDSGMYPVMTGDDIPSVSATLFSSEESEESDAEIASQIHQNLQRLQLSRIHNESMQRGISNEQSYIRSPYIGNRVTPMQSRTKEDSPSPFLERSATKLKPNSSPSPSPSPTPTRSTSLDAQMDDMWQLAAHALSEVSKKNNAKAKEQSRKLSLLLALHSDAEMRKKSMEMNHVGLLFEIRSFLIRLRAIEQLCVEFEWETPALQNIYPILYKESKLFRLAGSANQGTQSHRDAASS